MFELKRQEKREPSHIEVVVVVVVVVVEFIEASYYFKTGLF